MSRSFLVRLTDAVRIWAVTSLVAGAVLAFASTSVQAHDNPSDAPPAVPPAELYAPSRMPDRIVLTWTGDTTTTQTVTWRTSVDVTRAFAEIAVADAGPNFPEKAKRIEAKTQPYESDPPEWHLHVVEFRELSPATIYAYRVGDGTNWSEWFQFRTAPTTPEPFSFIYVGDAQTDLRSRWSRVIRQAFIDAPRAAFTLHAGDLVTDADDDALWGEWHGAGSWINAMIPVIATPGNHDYISIKKPDGSRERRVSRHWSQFTFPANGVPQLPGSVYYIDYQNLRIVSLDSNQLQAEQVEWLDKVLDTDRTWKIVTFHHPIYSTARGRDNVKLRELWKPIFDKHSVDLVLTGHDHAYGRSGLLEAVQNVPTGASVRTPAGGTVYVVSVSGPKMYDLDANPRTEFRRAAEDTQLYQIISIDGTTLRYEARTAVGDVYDAFTLKKRPGQPNEMIEQVPSTPERRRPPKPEKAAG
ncbi:MAG TPA: metallophosphoesterase family protein [Phycisphaerae bacterium]|nr:metallophosphoesterase family protein [Phycisphaerae bacterium]HOJ72898.1 metallophosphoesterase family protein [Phycisphaerae bacterium]HOM50082.1 metallophosphoesterase family protein [Phycisphaerae bacterium]HON69040.1 metallophosphoesterase family protein [Phycisphaerae bacterium]HPP26615.1 metallophosphoesterase family protein [Phycisphaerae bacterium]